MTIYRVQPDGDDTPTLWRAKDEDDQYPEGLAFLTSSGNTAVTNRYDDHGVVFRATEALLAPDEDVETKVAVAIADLSAAQFANLSPLLKRSFIGSARAAIRALRAHVEGAS